MHDSKPNTETTTMGIVTGFAIIFVAVIGIGGILDDSEKKEETISDLKQQLIDARKEVLLCEGRFQGYQQGRR